MKVLYTHIRTYRLPPSTSVALHLGSSIIDLHKYYTRDRTVHVSIVPEECKLEHWMHEKQYLVKLSKLDLVLSLLNTTPTSQTLQSFFKLSVVFSSANVLLLALLLGSKLLVLQTLQLVEEEIRRLLRDTVLCSFL